MKTKTFLSVFIFLNAFTAQATVHEVHVADFHFTPGQFDAIVGDTVKWIWDNGTHTTTGTAVNIPFGADTWDEPIDASHPSFEYVIKVAGSYFYFSKLDGDMSASFDATGILPVQLINFKITPAAFNKTLLSWNTVEEQNSAWFSIQRSSDTKRFTEIAQVPSAGNSSVLKYYSYTDNSNSKDEYVYYKIVTVDKDGNKTASDILSFKTNVSAANLVACLSPNPVSSPYDLNVQLNISKSEKILVQLYTAGGSLIKHLYMDATPGSNSKLRLGNISAGIYTIVFRLHTITESKTIVIQ